MLTGRPCVNGYLLPPPQYAGGGRGQVVWKAEHLWFDGRAGRVLRERRYRGEYSFGYNALSREAFEYVVAVLALEDPLRLMLTRAPGDPADAEETELLCEMTSPLPAAGGPDKSGGLYSLDVTLSTLGTRAERPGLSRGALDYGPGPCGDRAPGSDGGSSEDGTTPTSAALDGSTLTWAEGAGPTDASISGDTLTWQG